MLEELPKFIDPQRLMALTEILTGAIAPSRLRRMRAPYMPRLPVLVTLDVDAEDRRGPHITGRVETEIDATCQRCLGKMSIAIEQLVDIVLVDGDAAPSMDGDNDATELIAIEDERFDIEQFVEDEVVLACPMIPMHDDPVCHTTPTDKRAEGTERKRPFTVLADMLLASEKDKSGK